eukprot:357392-Chlamydomonas_euryale.AAC.20
MYFVITTATTNGYGDILPRSVAEEVITNLVMIMGMMMMGLVIGMVTRFSTRASGSAAEVHVQRNKLVAIDEWLDAHGVDDETKRRVKNIFSQDQPQSKLVNIFQVWDEANLGDGSKSRQWQDRQQGQPMRSTPCLLCVQTHVLPLSAWPCWRRHVASSTVGGHEMPCPHHRA